MNIKRFFANNSRDALALVRKALGPDAVILANRSVNGGNEIMALGSEDMDALAMSTAPHVEEVVTSAPLSAPPSHALGNRVPAFEPRLEDNHQPVYEPHHHKAKSGKTRTLLKQDTLDAPALNFSESETESLLAYIHKQNERQQAVAPVKKSSSKRMPLQEETFHDDSEPASEYDAMFSSARDSVQRVQPARVQTLKRSESPTHSSPHLDLSKPEAKTMETSKAELNKLMSEMRTMRGAIESQLSELVWENTQRRQPNTAAMLRLLLATGFAPGLSRRIVENMPTQGSEADAQKWVENILVKNIRAVESESELLDEGGIFAVIGPTGVGKTTTVAKMAARYVMKHGTNKLALITTDAYRIGGYEQLRIYGKILGVMVHSVKDEADLKIALNELKGKHTILIDTVGVNQRDSMVANQLAMLSGNNIKRLLCLNATCTAETLTDVVNIYKGKGLAGCIMTKLDEAATIGSTLDVVIREKLRLYYVTNGQRVPEDIHLANKRMLVHHAFKLNKRLDPHFKHRNEELPLVMAHAEKISHANLREEIRFDE